MPNFNRWSWLRTISQRVVPANAGTHPPGLKSDKRPLLQCRNESPSRMGPCVRRDDSLKIPYAIALPTRGRDKEDLFRAILGRCRTVLGRRCVGFLLIAGRLLLRRLQVVHDLLQTDDRAFHSVDLPVGVIELLLMFSAQFGDCLLH